MQIDHVTVAGARLDGMREALAASGLQPEYGGAHSNRATEMALVSFPDGSYLELIGIQKQADPAAVSLHVWSRFLDRDAGPCAFALLAQDLAGDIGQLKSAGIVAGMRETGGRTRPDGVKLEWRTADIEPARGLLFPFLIDDLTPRERRVYPAGRPTTTRFRGVAKVIVGVGDLRSATDLYRRAFRLPPPRLRTDPELAAELAWFEETPIVLAQGLDGGSWLSRRVREFGDAACAFVLASAANSDEMVGQWIRRKSEWFGRSILWMDHEKIGWRLGVEIGSL